MSTHKVCFYGEMKKIIPELSSNMVNAMFTAAKMTIPSPNLDQK